MEIYIELNTSDKFASISYIIQKRVKDFPLLYLKAKCVEAKNPLLKVAPRCNNFCYAHFATYFCDS